MSRNIHFLLDRNSNTLSYQNWERLSMKVMNKEIHEYNTFRSLVASLRRPHSRDAVILLRSRFAGFLGDVKVAPQDESLTNFLTEEGVLTDLSEGYYRMASALIDGLIRLKVIPVVFPAAPQTPPPLRNDDELLDVLNALIMSLEVFDRELMRLAPSRSYKSSKVRVGGSRNVRVPRESVYDTELIRLFSNWLNEINGWTVTGQWHLQTTHQHHKYTDIVLQKNDNPPIVLELVATGDVTFVQSHIEKIPEYMALLSAREAWVVHFTCEDNYNPIWQSTSELNKGVNVVHFIHDLAFTKVLMMACWKDDAGVHKDEKWLSI
jgi:hypothetical protein